MTITVSTAGAAAMLAGLAQHVGAGATLRLYTGPVPADVSAALVGATELVAAPVTGGAGSVADRVLSWGAIAEAWAVAGGVPSFWRLERGDGAAVLQGTAGPGPGTDLALSDVRIDLGAPFLVASYSVMVP